MRGLCGCALYPATARRSAKWLTLEKLRESHALRGTRGSGYPGLKKKKKILLTIAKQLVANLMTHCVTVFCKQIRDLSRFDKSEGGSG